MYILENVSHIFDTQKNESNKIDREILNTIGYDSIIDNDIICIYSPDSIVSFNAYNELTESKEDYFQNSKIRDEKGNLLTVYHGSPNGTFNSFNTTNNADRKSAYQLLFGSHFTADDEIAKEYADERPGGHRKKKVSPKVYAVHLNIKNPLDLTNINENVIADYTSNLMKPYSQKEKFNKVYSLLTPAEIKRNMGQNSDGRYFVLTSLLDSISPKRAYELVQKLGYDGVIYEAVYTRGSKKPKDLSYIALYANQIKSIDNNNPTDSDNIEENVIENWID